jgi:hypothetical protein
MKHTLWILSLAAIGAACGSSPRQVSYDDQGSELASVTINPPANMKAGTDFNRITVSYLKGDSGSKWTDTKEFKVGSWSDPELRLPTGSYTFALSVYLDQTKKAESKQNDTNCPYLTKDLKAGGNTLSMSLCNYDLSSGGNEPVSKDASVTIDTVIKDRNGNVINNGGGTITTTSAELQLDANCPPTAKVRADKTLTVVVYAKPKELRAGQTCTVKAKASAKKTSDQVESILEKTAAQTIDAGASTSKELRIELGASDFASYEKATKVDLVYKCGNASGWTALGSQITVVNE